MKRSIIAAGLTLGASLAGPPASTPVYEQFASEVPGGAALIKTIQNLR